MKTVSKIVQGMTILIAILVPMSCSTDTPTEPTFVVGAGGNLMNSNLQATILKCDLLFDGSVIATANFSQANGLATLNGTVSSVKKGSHSISFRITSQTSSPNTYETVGANAMAGTSSFHLTDQKKSLATGESFSFTIDVE